MKEEEELREIYSSFVPKFMKVKLADRITALVRAVREDCARVAENEMYSPSDIRSDKYNAGCDRAAAAIRGKRMKDSYGTYDGRKEEPAYECPSCAAALAGKEDAEVRLKGYESEKFRRMYYQGIVYAVCNWIDSIEGKIPGHGVVCGTYETPSEGVEEALARIKGRLRPYVVTQDMEWRERANAAVDAVQETGTGLSGDEYIKFLEQVMDDLNGDHNTTESEIHGGNEP